MANSGFLLINKKIGITSFDVIRNLRRSIGIKKMGHAGTLDPMATGLLVIAVDQATRILNHVPTSTKTYRFGIQFGETRDTDDSDGDVLESGFRTPSQEEFEAALPKFTGEISQVPPKYSAVKIDGKRAYDLARQGEDVVIKPRNVTISYLKLLEFNTERGEAICEALCSTGTYVRSLARDIAESLNSGAYASSIHRTTVGEFKIEDAVDVEAVTSTDSLISPQELIPIWDSVTVTDSVDLALLRNGNRVKIWREDLDYIWVIDGEDDRLLALAKIEDEILKPIKVFTE
jgi:tRNA pseudouridine55 synthase